MDWKRQQQKTNQMRHVLSVITATLLGALIGAAAGLGVCVYLISFTILFPGDTMVFGALLCGTLGFVYGESFVDWLLENFWHFI